MKMYQSALVSRENGLQLTPALHSPILNHKASEEVAFIDSSYTEVIKDNKSKKLDL